MRKTVVLALFTATLSVAQTFDFAGVWKADLEKSKRNGPPITNYLETIEQKMAVFNNRTKEEAPLVTETTGIWTERGPQRTVLSFFNNAQANVRYYQGVPVRMTATMDGKSLVVNGETSGRPNTFKRVYALSADGQTLTITEDAMNDGRALHSSIVLMKQPESAAEPLKQPEEIASAHFKNVKTEFLKNLPLSEFIDNMHYFSWALNKNCEFCHVARKFDLDDKKEKQTARKMIEMTASIDAQHFDGHPAVRCFTCHEGHTHPLQRWQYEDEIAADKARAEKEAAEKAAAQPH